MQFAVLLGALLAPPLAWLWSGWWLFPLTCVAAFLLCTALVGAAQLGFLVFCVLRYHTSPSDPQSLSTEAASGRPSVTIQGCGYLFPFANGVLQYVYERFEFEEGLYLATSAGVFPTMALVMQEGPVEWLRRDWPKCWAFYSVRPTGAFLQGSGFVAGIFDAYISEEAHKRACRILRPVLTRLSLATLKAEPMIAKDFDSRQTLLDVLLAAIGIPIFSINAAWSFVGNMRCIDAAFCISAAKVDERTVLITPFAADDPIIPKGFKYKIGPEAKLRTRVRGPPKLWKMLMPEWTTVFFPSDMPTCEKLAEEGYLRAQACHDLWVKAGWKPRSKPLPSAF